MKKEKSKIINYTVLPCPFCGGAAKVKPYNFAKYKAYYSSCENKDCRVLPSTSLQENPLKAAILWNTPIMERLFRNEKLKSIRTQRIRPKKEKEAT